MGTEITLDIGPLVITCSKNHVGIDHNALFKEKDRMPCTSDQIDYNFFNATGYDPTDAEMCFICTLGDILPRLELLGFNLKGAEIAYNKYLSEYIAHAFDTLEEYEQHKPVDFSGFLDFVTSYDIKDLDNSYSPDNFSSSKVEGRFHGLEIINYLPSAITFDAYSEASYFGELINILHPYFILRILAENPNNLTEKVIWRYGLLVENGWAEDSDFKSALKKSDTFLIATEGKSDLNILKHAFQAIYPNIEDFFKFIDPDKSYSYFGATNLFKFAQGLISIDIQNKVIFLFDNDIAGLEAYDKLNQIDLPRNLDAVTLPDIESFKSFPALGPEGIKRANINGTAAAIECYLDLSFQQEKEPFVIWTNYKKEFQKYHGSLDNKEAYTKIFLKQKSDVLLNSSYNIEKIKLVLDMLILRCQNIASKINSENELIY